jgi:hypothetical protein
MSNKQYRSVNIINFLCVCVKWNIFVQSASVMCLLCKSCSAMYTYEPLLLYLQNGLVNKKQ